MPEIPPLAAPFNWEAVTIVFSGIWIALTTDSLYSFVTGILTESLERNIVHGANFAGILTSAIQWADSVGLISLGALAAVAQALGFGASGVIAFVGSLESCRMLFQAQERAGGACEQTILAVLQLGYRVSMLAWSILGITSFIAGAALLPTVGSILFLTSFLFFMASIVYRHRLEREQTAGSI